MKIRSAFVVALFIVPAFGSGCSFAPKDETASYAVDKSEQRPLPAALQNRLERLLHEIQFAQGTTLLAELRELSAFGNYATQPVIDRMLKSDDVRLRAGAIYVLGEIDRLDGDPRAKEAVAAALSDNDRSVRLEAARALLESGDKRAANLLVDALDDPLRGVRIRAFLSLSTAAGEKYGYDPDGASEVRRAAADRFRSHFASAAIVTPVQSPMIAPAATMPTQQVPTSSSPSIPGETMNSTGSTDPVHSAESGGSTGS